MWNHASRDFMMARRPTCRLAVQKQIRARKAQNVIIPDIDTAGRPFKRTAASALDKEPAVIARQLLAALTVPAIFGSFRRACWVMLCPRIPPLNVMATNSET